MRDSRLTAGQRQQQHFQFPARTHWYTQTLCGNILLLNKIKFKKKKISQLKNKCWCETRHPHHYEYAWLLLSSWTAVFSLWNRDRFTYFFVVIPSKASKDFWNVNNEKLQVKVDCYWKQVHVVVYTPIPSITIQDKWPSWILWDREKNWYILQVVVKRRG